jgi:hypothetical protein
MFEAEPPTGGVVAALLGLKNFRIYIRTSMKFQERKSDSKTKKLFNWSVRWDWLFEIAISLLNGAYLWEMITAYIMDGSINIKNVT